MSKNVLVISSSLRKGGNSETLADFFISGAQVSGNNVEKISLIGKNIAFCKGCLTCGKTGKCIISDDAVDIYKKMAKADVIAFATPIYYYEMCGQLKTMLDRANPIYGTDYNFRDIYMLSSAAEDEETAADRAVSGLQGWIDCFPKARLAGALLATGVDEVGAIKGNSVLQRAYDLGRDIK